MRDWSDSDAGGAGAIQVVGGLSALSVTWLMGPRRGKFSADVMPTAIPGHNAVFVTFGAFLALIGWFGLNSSAAILFYGASPARIALIAVNTALSAGSALLAAALVTRTRFGKARRLPQRQRLDRGPGGVQRRRGIPGPRRSSHGGAGRGRAGHPFGRVAGAALEDRRSGRLHFRACRGRNVGIDRRWISGPFPRRLIGRAGEGQWMAQFTGVATLVGFMFPMIYGLNWTLDRIYAIPRGPRRRTPGHGPA